MKARVYLCEIYSITALPFHSTTKRLQCVNVFPAGVQHKRPTDVNLKSDAHIEYSLQTRLVRSIRNSSLFLIRDERTYSRLLLQKTFHLELMERPMKCVPRYPERLG